MYEIISREITVMPVWCIWTVLADPTYLQAHNSSHLNVSGHINMKAFAIFSLCH